MMQDSQEKPSTEVLDNLKKLRKSSQDKIIAGICGGLGEFTPLPSWMWRALFLLFLCAGGFGLIAYIVLWLTMPPPRPGTAG